MLEKDKAIQVNVEPQEPNERKKEKKRKEKEKEKKGKKSKSLRYAREPLLTGQTFFFFFLVNCFTQVFFFSLLSQFL
jgi:hypothetical protein